MAEPATARSPLAALADDLADMRADGVALVARPARARLNFRLDPEDAEALAAVGGVLGTALPLVPSTASTADGRTALWLGPDEWLLCAPAADGAALADALGAALDGRHHALTDVSAMYATLALSGAGAREVLMKGCRLDLHARAFALGACVQTALATGAGDPAHDRRRADLRDHRAQLVLRLPRHLAPRRHGGVRVRLSGTPAVTVAAAPWPPPSWPGGRG